MDLVPAQIPVDVPTQVSGRARAWAHTILSLEPKPRTPDELAPYLQAIINSETNRALLLVERALVEQITP